MRRNRVWGRLHVYHLDRTDRDETLANRIAKIGGYVIAQVLVLLGHQQPSRRMREGVNTTS